MSKESTPDIFKELERLTTEARNPRSTNLDRLSVGEILNLIHQEDAVALEAVGNELPTIEKAVHLILAAMEAGGRLLYVGAGTSGRLGVLDAAECPPTFGVDPAQVVGVMAGGSEALVRAVEGAEDDGPAGALAMADHEVGPKDVVCGIAASRRTPYVLAAVAAARDRGAKTLYLTMNPRQSIDFPVDVAICPIVGPEVLMGSTRMKAALAQKMILTLLTTAVFVRRGTTYENMMVDLMATSAKLRERGKRVVMMVTGCDYDTAARTIGEAEGSVKTAIVMLMAGVTVQEARLRLEQARGFVRDAIHGHNGQEE